MTKKKVSNNYRMRKTRVSFLVAGKCEKQEAIRRKYKYSATLRSCEKQETQLQDEKDPTSTPCCLQVWRTKHDHFVNGNLVQLTSLSACEKQKEVSC